MQTRQDFTKAMVNTLQTGADNLVLADSNLEGANMLALQTRQSLSTIPSRSPPQASQSVLRLRLRPIRGQKIGGGAKSPAVFYCRS